MMFNSLFLAHVNSFHQPTEDITKSWPYGWRTEMAGDADGGRRWRTLLRTSHTIYCITFLFVRCCETNVSVSGAYSWPKMLIETFVVIVLTNKTGISDGHFFPEMSFDISRSSSLLVYTSSCCFHRPMLLFFTSKTWFIMYRDRLCIQLGSRL